MAVRKAKSTEEVVTEVTEVETEVEVDIETEVEAPVEIEIGETPEVEVEETTSDLEVNEDVAKVDDIKKPEGKVKIRMRVDHKCCIAMERYDLKAGKTYVVPENVKRILNKAGLLAPL